MTDSVFENYTPQRLSIPGASPHPGLLVQSAAMSAVEPPATSYSPNLPAAVIDSTTAHKVWVKEEGANKWHQKTTKAPALALPQLESIVYAGQTNPRFRCSEVWRTAFGKWEVRAGYARNWYATRYAVRSA